MRDGAHRYERVRPADPGRVPEIWEAEQRGPLGFRKAVWLERATSEVEALDRARVGSSVAHPGLLAVLEPVEVEGGWWVATERCDGRRFTAEDAADRGLAHQVARALAAIHVARDPAGAPRSHGALTAASLLVDPWDRAVVVDLGRHPAGAPAGDVAAWAALFAPCGAVDEAWRELLGRCAHADACPADGAALVAAIERAQAGGDPFEEAGNLPASRDAFVGRAEEVRAVAGRLADGARLVTLVGTGGIGKTRLAVEVARWRPWAGGAWFCDVSEARSVEALCAVVRGVLQVEARGGDPVARLGHALAGRPRLLLVLDNLEQVAEPAAAAVGRWLEAAPQLVVLGTSRIPLRLPAEEVVAVGPLAERDAVTLFTTRAPRAPEQGDLDQVLEIARHLEGLPLALELVAARTRLLGVRGVWSRMRERYRLASGGGPERPARHRSLSASMDFSWELLTPAERAALARSTVFAGGFDAEAARAVLDVDPDDAALAELVAHGLLGFDAATGRYHLAESVAEYARDHLGPAARAAAVARHARHYARFGSERDLPRQFSAQWKLGLRAIRRERDNVIAASDRAFAEPMDPEVAVACGLAAGLVLALDGRADEARRHYEACRAFAPDLRAGEVDLALATAARKAGRPSESVEPLERAAARLEADGRAEIASDAHRELAVTWLALGRSSRAEAALDAAEALSRRVGDLSGEAAAVGVRASLLGKAGRLSEARSAARRALAMSEAAGDEPGVTLSRNKLGAIAVLAGDLDEAEAALVGTLSDWPRAGGAQKVNLAVLELTRGRLDAALRWIREGLDTHRITGELRSHAAARSVLGEILMEQGELDPAARELRAALADRERYGDPGQVATLASLARLDLARGDPAAAEGWVLRAEALTTAEADREARGELHAAAAEVAAALGRWDEAERELAELAHTVARMGAGASSPLGVKLARARAAVEAARG